MLKPLSFEFSLHFSGQNTRCAPLTFAKQRVDLWMNPHCHIGFGCRLANYSLTCISGQCQGVISPFLTLGDSHISEFPSV